mmetsp:Transcript_15923/g.34595  ORF Transcript_15923/g.34595 Transcript_15923/m.34595 type:complete len:200 (+) Transcript_15923:1381-1980(+)
MSHTASSNVFPPQRSKTSLTELCPPLPTGLAVSFIRQSSINPPGTRPRLTVFSYFKMVWPPSSSLLLQISRNSIAASQMIPVSSEVSAGVSILIPLASSLSRSMEDKRESNVSLPPTFLETNETYRFDRIVVFRRDKNDVVMWRAAASAAAIKSFVGAVSFASSPPRPTSSSSDSVSDPNAANASSPSSDILAFRSADG